MKENKNLSLFFTFFKIGAFTFGGGYAMIPLIKRDIVDDKKWITNEEMLDVVAVAESTPGPVAINMATFVGQNLAGFWGAACATLGVTIPSFIIIMILSVLLDFFGGQKAMEYAFIGIRAVVLVLVGSALISLFKQSKKDIFTLLITGVSLFSVVVLDVNPILIIIAAGFLGFLRMKLVLRRREK